MLFASPALAQSQAAMCNQIRVELATLDRTAPPGGAGNAREIQRLRTELSRAQVALRTNECGQRGLFFSPPPVCAPLQAQANQIAGRLQQLEGGRGAGARGPDGARRAQLVAAFQRFNCDGSREPQRGVIYAQPQPPSLFEQIFGGRPSQVVVDPDPEPQREIDPELAEELREKARLGGRMAICVRTCDGAFFPVNFEGLGRGDGYKEVCEALCPSAETEVFFMRLGAEIDTAATRSGTPYMSMPYAKQFQTKIDSSCTCKPRHETWAQRAKAIDEVIELRRGDIVVTPEHAAAVSRLRPPTPQTSPRRNARQPAPPVDDTPVPVPESQIPTAGTASAGIGPRATQGNAVISQSQGQVQEVVGPDGQKRQVRVLTPNRTAQ